MTTDTAVRVTRIIVQDKGICTDPNGGLFSCRSTNLVHLPVVTVPLDQIPYIDYPELRINQHESTEMPFRYVKGEDGKPIMPEVSLPPRILPEFVADSFIPGDG